MRAAHPDDLRLIATQLATGVHLLRFLPDDAPHYDLMIVVRKLRLGELHLLEWVGKPLAPVEWRDAHHSLFSNAWESNPISRLSSSSLLYSKMVWSMGREITGQSADLRRAVRQARSKPKLEALHAPAETQLTRI